MSAAPNPVSSLEIGGGPVDLDRRYRVTVSSMLAGGFNRFETLLAGAERTGGPDDTAAIETHLAPTLTGEPLVPPQTDRISVAP